MNTNEFESFVKIVAEVKSASTSAFARSVRTAGAAHIAYTRNRNTLVKSAKVQESASTDESEELARKRFVERVAAAQFVSTTDAAAPAKSVKAAQSVNIIVFDKIAKTAVVVRFVSTITIAASAKTAVLDEYS